ncbi:MAG: alpha-galactosidase [Clostridiaceae bacterium]|nr:alpha-galactosidase [Clostridiaceae bacterium]
MHKNCQNTASEAFYTRLISDLPAFPAAFTYNGVPYHGFPASDFTVLSRGTEHSSDRRADMLTLSAPDNLTVTVKTAFWCDFGVSEWTIYFENRGNTDTGELSEVYCCDLTVPGHTPVLRGILGDHENQYRPYTVELSQKPAAFVSTSGRPTHINFPYFNLECGDGGVLLALGWAGSWSADFMADGDRTHVLGRSTVGLNAVLHPGEKIRTALTVYAPYYVRSEDDAMNFWRAWFVRCNMPKADATGHPLTPFSTCCLASDTGLPNSDGSISERYFTWKPSIDMMLSVGAKTDFRWVDAGWYSDPEGNTVEKDWWGTVGSWELDPVKWPGTTFADSTAYTRAHGMKTLMWFEPERVTNPDALSANYGYRPEWAIRVPGQRTITNNLGDPDCLQWTTRRICKVLRENRVDMYREDNNSNPGELWRHLDALDGRAGITECRAVAAHYKLWDDILATTKAIGGCGFCDSCASGGGRNDIESLRRGIPMLRSDSDRSTTALRLSMTTSFNRWIPFCGANTKEKAWQLDATGRSDVYTWRASYLPALNVDTQFVQDPGQDFDMLRFGLREWDRVKGYLLADFYVLTPWHPESERTEFTAYSFFDPEREEGVLLVFRMEDCERDTFRVTLPYTAQGMTLDDADSGESFPYTPGMQVIIREKRATRLFYVHKR